MNNQDSINSSIEILPGPIPENIQQNNNGTCKLILHRKKAAIGSMIKFDVKIDDQKVGVLKNGKTLELDIPVGYHTIYVCRNSAFTSYNPMNIISFLIKSDTTMDIFMDGPGGFGITNINGEGNHIIYK